MVAPTNGGTVQYTTAGHGGGFGCDFDGQTTIDLSQTLGGGQALSFYERGGENPTNYQLQITMPYAAFTVTLSNCVEPANNGDTAVWTTNPGALVKSPNEGDVVEVPEDGRLLGDFSYVDAFAALTWHWNLTPGG